MEDWRRERRLPRAPSLRVVGEVIRIPEEVVSIMVMVVSGGRQVVTSLSRQVQVVRVRTARFNGGPVVALAAGGTAPG